jgi:plastocyanin
MTTVAPSAPAPAPAAGAGDRPRAHRPRWWRWGAAALVAAMVITGLAYGALAVTADDPTAAPALGPGDTTVRLDIEHSLFSPTSLRVVEGTRVRFVVVNGDPIHHELIVGPPDVHARHENGTEASTWGPRRSPPTPSTGRARSSSRAISPAITSTGCTAPSRSSPRGDLAL